MVDKIYDYYNFPEWVDSDWKKLYDLACSYKRAIEVLLYEETKETSIYSERNIFPPLVLIHFYIELIFKSLILQGEGKLRITHDLSELLKGVKKLHPNLNLTEEEQFIDFLNKENPKAEAFRYNFDKNQKEYFVSQKREDEKAVSLSYIWINIYGIFSVIDGYFKTIK